MSRHAAATLGLFALATRLGAQTLPVPSLTPPAETAPLPQGWEYCFGTGIGRDGNIDFLVPDGPSGVAIAPYAVLARTRRGPRSEVRTAASGRWLTYPEQGLDRSYLDVGVDAHHRISPRTDARATASYGLGYSDRSRILLEQATALPVVKARTLSASLGLVSRRGRHTSVRLDGRLYRTEFDSPALIDGQSLRATVGLETVRERTIPAFEYAVEQVGSGGSGRPYLTHFAALQWTRVLSARSALLLQGGASLTPEAARAGLEHEKSFFGGAAFTHRSKRSNLTVFVRREVAPAFGLGRSRLELRSGLDAALPLGRAWELRLFGTHVAPDPGPAAERAYGASEDILASLGRRLGRRLEVSAEARYRRRGASARYPALESLQAGLFVTVLSPSGRAIPPTSALP